MSITMAYIPKTQEQHFEVLQVLGDHTALITNTWPDETLDALATDSAPFCKWWPKDDFYSAEEHNYFEGDSVVLTVPTSVIKAWLTEKEYINVCSMMEADKFLGG